MAHNIVRLLLALLAAVSITVLAGHSRPEVSLSMGWLAELGILYRSGVPRASGRRYR